MEVKSALRDKRFRENLPIDFNQDVQKYMQNPGCACNLPLYRRVLTEASKNLEEYYPGRKVTDLDDELKKISLNHFSVINCHVAELEAKLRKLPPGRKQIAVTRYEDQATVVINELDLIF